MQVWMSHGDAVKEAPKDFVVIGKTNTAPFAAIAHVEKPIYGIQFHAEVTHSHRGKEVIGRFVKDICQCSGEWTMVSSLVRHSNESSNRNFRNHLFQRKFQEFVKFVVTRVVSWVLSLVV